MICRRKRHSLAWLLLLATAPMAFASSEGKRVPPDPTYVSECGSCHVPYPPRMLPSESWKILLGGLGKHFDVDASLDEAALNAVSNFVLNNARRASSKEITPPTRITTSRWFLHEHDEISEAVWKQIKSKAKCEACHTNAQQGRFSEHELKLPKP
jgi:hypothetical protein